MAIRQNKMMPFSLVVRDPAKLKQHLHEALSFVLDETSNGLPTVVVTIEGDFEQSMEVAFDPHQLDALVEELKELQAAVQWQMARSHWLFVHHNTKSKWHLRLKQWGEGHLCSTKPRYEPTTSLVIDAGLTLWDGTVCNQCVKLWTEQILSGWVRYQYAPNSSPRSLSSGSEATISTEGDET